jgi:hypothetical protein
VGTEFVAADVTLRALELDHARRFDELASEDLVGSLFNFLLQWEGDVTLPPDATPGTRFRLVIAEYEEYVVDDDPAYFRVPTRKDRRLVFVEHVEFN